VVVRVISDLLHSHSVVCPLTGDQFPDPAGGGGDVFPAEDQRNEQEFSELKDDEKEGSFA
jgi:hypothetical protein